MQKDSLTYKTSKKIPSLITLNSENACACSSSMNISTVSITTRWAIGQKKGGGGGGEGVFSHHGLQTEDKNEL